MLVCTVVLGSAVALTAATAPTDPTPTAAVAVDADPGDDRIALTHRGGDVLDVRDLALRVTVAGEPLDRQPPVPFFSASGFDPGPTGPFNLAADPEWRAGETASFRVAGTNDPGIEPGDRVRVVVSVDGGRVASAETTARN
ncbi:type IV pilin [Halostella sp. JP-L12]|nr:type IV pilin [Halostella sp. JP-L12]